MSYDDNALADQRPALDALVQIGRTLGHLPAADFGISPVFPNRLGISLHGNLSDFELWRDTLGLPPGAVKYHTQSNVCVLRATAPWGGASVELVGYGPLPKADTDTAGGEQA